MVDPFSVITIVGTAVHTATTIAQQVYRFTEDAKRVSQAVADVAGEILAIERTLKSIESTLKKQREAESLDGNNHDLWESAHGSISECHVSLKRLGGVISALLPDHPNAALQTVRTFKLNFRQTELNGLRTQLISHKSNLQLVLQMINLQATYTTPGRIVDELEPKIDELRQLMLKSQKINEDAVANGLPQPNKHYESLRRSAEKVITSATTVSSNSETASIAGDRMSEAKRRNTLDWIPENSHVFVEVPESERSAPIFQDPFLFSEPATTPTVLTDPSVGPGDESVLDESDSDEDLQSELVEAHFQKGRERFEAKQYAEAQSYYRKYLEHAHKLPIKRRKSSQVADVRLGLAACLCHTTNLQEAEARLFYLTQSHSAKGIETEEQATSSEQSARNCQASHLLAVVLYRRGKFEAAKSYCRKAVLGRRRTLGKEHIDYHHSQYLMFQILEAEGSHEDSSVWYDRIPTEFLSKLVRIEDEFPESSDLEPVSPFTQTDQASTIESTLQETTLPQQPELEISSSRGSPTSEAEDRVSPDFASGRTSSSGPAQDTQARSPSIRFHKNLDRISSSPVSPSDPLAHVPKKPPKPHRNTLAVLFRRKSSSSNKRASKSPPKASLDPSLTKKVNHSRSASSPSNQTELTSPEQGSSPRRERSPGSNDMSFADFLRQKADEENSTQTDKMPVWQGLF